MNLSVKITPKTRTKDALALFAEDHPERIKAMLDSTEEVAIDKPILEMSIEEFRDASSDEYFQRYFNEKYFVNALGKYKCYLRQMEEVEKLLQMYTIQKTPEEESAMQGVKFPDAFSMMANDLAVYYHLGTIEDGQKQKLATYIWLCKLRKAESDYTNNLNEIRKEASDAR